MYLPPSPPSLCEFSGEEVFPSNLSMCSVLPLPASLYNAKDNDSNWGDMMRGLGPNDSSEFLKIFFSFLLIKAEYPMSRNEKPHYKIDGL